MANKGKLIDVKPVNLLAEVIKNLVSQSKINPKSMNNPPKVYQQLMKNRSWERHEAQYRLLCFFGGSWVRFVGHNHKRPTWPQLGSQDGAQIA